MECGELEFANKAAMLERDSEWNMGLAFNAPRSKYRVYRKRYGRVVLNKHTGVTTLQPVHRERLSAGQNNTEYCEG